MATVTIKTRGATGATITEHTIPATIVGSFAVHRYARPNAAGQLEYAAGNPGFTITHVRTGMRLTNRLIHRATAIRIARVLETLADWDFALNPDGSFPDDATRQSLVPVARYLSTTLDLDTTYRLDWQADYQLAA